MTEKEINEKVGKIRSKKLVGLPIGLLALFVATILVGAAILTIYSTYTGTQTGDIEVTGVTSKLVWDSEPMTVQTFDIPMDVSSLTAGDSELHTHTCEVLDGYGDVYPVCGVTFDHSAMDWAESDPEYGFYFDVLVDGVSVIDSTTYVYLAGGPIDFDFEYELDENFMDIDDPIAFDLDVEFAEVTAANCPPIPVQDDYDETDTIVEGTTRHTGLNDWNVVGNDIDYVGGGLTLISIDSGDFLGDLTITAGKIHYASIGQLDDGYLRTGHYVVENSLGIQQTGTFTLDLTGV